MISLAISRRGAHSLISINLDNRAVTPVRACELPAASLLQRHRLAGAYTDCFFVDTPGTFSHAAFVEAFYTSATFGVERRLLTWFLDKPSTDQQARDLANGRLDSFAAWRVESRATNQLLLADFQGRTRSWLMTTETIESGATRLYFGSAVVPITDARTGKSGMGPAFRALLGFHKLYSRLLLRAAAARLADQFGKRQEQNG